MKTIYLLIVCGILFVSCGKEYLDIKRDANQVVPNSLRDYTAILDYKSVMNENLSSTLMMTAGEEYAIKDEVYETMQPTYASEQRAYLWQVSDIYEDRESRDWNMTFQRIMYANLVRDLEKLTPAPNEKQDWENTLGRGHFHWAWNYFRLLLQFGKQWTEDIANEKCPIPLRVDYDIEDKGEFVTYNEIYEKLINALLSAAELLPETQPSKTRPTKSAAYLLLSKVYLQKNDFEKALNYSLLSLSSFSELLDYNRLDTSRMYPFNNDHGKTNDEIVYYQTSGSIQPLADVRMIVSNGLLSLYAENDLRRSLYFKIRDNRVVFRGSYHGDDSNFFIGLTTAEAYLIKAECLARKGEVMTAIEALETLLKHRYLSGSDYNINKNISKEALIRKILEERRKELCFRAVRWEDLRRLNAEGVYTESLYRTVNNTTYENRWDTGTWNWDIPRLN